MSDFLKILVVCALASVAGFVGFCSLLTTVEEMPVDAVNTRFSAARQQFQDPTPMRVRDATGQVLHLRFHDGRIVPSAPSDLVVMAWRGPEPGFVETRVPIWFLGLWEPARDFMFRDSRFDPAEWSLTVNDIQMAGSGVVIDHVGRGGERLLVWAE